MNIFRGFGFTTSENGAVWENLFTMQGLVFLGILALLIWGLYSWFKGRNNESVADQRFNEEVQALKQMDNETVQDYLREKELERQRALDEDDEWNIENYMNYKRDNPK